MWVIEKKKRQAFYLLSPLFQCADPLNFCSLYNSDIIAHVNIIRCFFSSNAQDHIWHCSVIPGKGHCFLCPILHTKTFFFVLQSQNTTICLRKFILTIKKLTAVLHVFTCFAPSRPSCHTERLGGWRSHVDDNNGRVTQKRRCQPRGLKVPWESNR